MTFRNFQNEAAKHLKDGKSVLIHAPTGLGKTWATAKGFIDSLPKSPEKAPSNALLGTRLLHVLPMRALASSVASDIATLLDSQGFAKTYVPTIHHGQQQESEIFAERIGVTTIDQYLAGFAGAPLSFANKSGHAVAGAIIASYSVFDEVHLLGPERGLPLLYAILQQRQRWGLLSAVMTATLPTSVRQYLCKEVGLESVQLSEADIQARDGWRKVTLTFEGKVFDSKSVATKILGAQQSQGKVIAFVNTVDAAIELYKELENKISPECKLRVIHSNYAPSHRKEREKELLELFGRDSIAQAIVITTQVAEAGINISAPIVFSEIAPVDSLIQRAGRCARFNTSQEVKGQFVVYKPEREKSHIPYGEDLVERTRIAFENRGSAFRLEWATEQTLVDEVLDAHYAHFIRGENVSRKDAEIKKVKKGQVTVLPKPLPKTKGITISDALGILDQTFHSRDPKALESTLRDINNVQVIVLSERPTNDSGAMLAGDESVFASSAFEKFLSAQNKLWPSQRDTVESIPVSYGRFSRSLEECELWEVQTTRVEYSAPTVTLQRHRGRVLPNHTYAVLQSDAGYSPTLGLTFGLVEEAQISDAAVTPIIQRDNQPTEKYEHYFQTWLDHCSRVYTKADEMLSKSYSAWILNFSKRMQERSVIEDAQDFSEKVESMIRLAALFHDIGKLNKPWQLAIGWTEGAFWGKSNDNKVAKLPPHAFYALPALRYLFKELGVVNEQGNIDRLAELMALASARHHSLGSLEGTMVWSAFETHVGVLEAVHEILEQVLLDQAKYIKPLITQDLFEHLNDDKSYHLHEGKYTYTLDTPSPSEDYYPFYVLASRIIKVSDWEASGQREVELCH